MSIGVASQVTSSLSNFLFTLIVSRSTSAAEFGRFAIIYAAFAVVLGLARTSLFEPRLMATTAGARRGNLPLSVAALALSVSLLLGPTSIAIGYNQEGIGVSLAVALPVVLLNDLGRYLAMAANLYHRALASDLVWLTVMGGFVVVSSGRTSNPSTAVAIWGFGAALGLLINSSLILTDVRGGPARPSAPLVVDHLLMTSRGLVFIAVMAAYFGPVPVAAIALSQLLYQPLTSLLHGLRYAYLRAMDELGFGSVDGEAESGSNPALHRSIRSLSFPLTLAAVGAAWAVALSLVPTDLGIRTVGPSFEVFALALWPLAGFEILRFVELGVLDRFRPATRRQVLPRIRAVSLIAILAVCGLVVAGAFAAWDSALWWRFGAMGLGILAAGAVGRRNGTDSSSGELRRGRSTVDHRSHTPQIRDAA